MQRQRRAGEENQIERKQRNACWSRHFISVPLRGGVNEAASGPLAFRRGREYLPPSGRRRCHPKASCVLRRAARDGPGADRTGDILPHRRDVREGEFQNDYWPRRHPRAWRIRAQVRSAQMRLRVFRQRIARAFPGATSAFGSWYETSYYIRSAAAEPSTQLKLFRSEERRVGKEG